MTETRILLALEASYYRLGLAVQIEKESHFRVVGHVLNNDDYTQGLSRRPHLVIVSSSLQFPEGSAWEQVRLRHSRIVLLLQKHDPTLLQKAWTAGVKGFMLANVGGDELILLLKLVRNNMRGLCKSLSQYNCLLEKPEVPLTPVEQTIVQLSMEGKMVKEIAAVVFKSRHTVTHILKKLRKRFGVKTKLGLIRFCAQRGWVG